jgi:hypothetical protein
MSLRSGEPHKRVSCGPQASEEKSVVPPRWCRVLLILRGYSETERLLEEVVDDGLEDDDPSSWCKDLQFSSMVTAFSPSQINIRGFQPVTRYTNIILEYGL